MAKTYLQKTSEKGSANGYAGLDGSGKVPLLQLPPTQPAIVTQYRPEDYGAVRDGTTDDSAAITACINAAVAACVADGSNYCEVQFTAGVYQTTRTPVTGGTTKGRAQIPLPVIAPTAQKVTLVLKGARDVALFPHWLQTIPQRTGAVIRSSLTGLSYDATFGSPSVIGGPTVEQFGYTTSTPNFNNMLIVIDGLQVNGPVSPSFYGFDLRLMGAANVKNAACQAEQVPSSAVLPATNFMTALAMPIQGNNAYCQLGQFACEGWYRAIMLGEHTNASYVGAVHCARGIGVSGPSPHGMCVGMATIENCLYAIEYVDISPVAFPGTGISNIVISMLQTEVGTGDDEMTRLVDDPNNKIYGTINYSDNDGEPFTLNGASNLKIRRQSLGRGAGVVTPAVPASTVAAPLVYADAAVTVAGGTVTAITVDGVATGQTSGTVIVPSGKTIAVTYSVAPTWKWTLL